MIRIDGRLMTPGDDWRIMYDISWMLAFLEKESIDRSIRQ